MDDTVAGKGQRGSQGDSVVCSGCAKVLEGQPNFCDACGADLRGLSGQSDTFSGSKVIDGRYKLLEKLGEGGMGSVFKVEHVRMGKIAALKVMRSDAAVDKGLKARFLQEARVVAKLSHPNTVQVFDAGELDDGSLFMAMEYVPGKDLAWNLRAHGRMHEDAAISIAVQLLASLAEAHDAGVVHRDLKPANVMLLRKRKGGDEQVKLLDFGIAKLAESEVRNSTTGDFVGTPAYMSPEQVRGDAVDARSDLYSLGALLFELVTGRQLYTGPTAVSIVRQHLEQPVPDLAEVAPDAPVSPEFRQIVTKALAKTPGERFADAEAMRQALDGLRKARGHQTRDLTPLPDVLASRMLSREDFEGFERKLRLQRVLAPIAAVLVVAALVLGGWNVLQHAQATQGPSEVEVEPNDHVQRATLIELGKPVRGAMGAAPAGESDRDLFVATVPEGPVRVTLSGVPDLNLTLEVLQLRGQKLERMLFLDDVGLGADERVDGLRLAAGSVYLRVEEQPFCTEPPRPPREKSLVPYTLTLEAMPQTDALAEVEPNDTVENASPLALTRATVASVGSRLDDVERLMALRPEAFSTVDFWRVDAAPSEHVVMVVVPPERGSLLVWDEAELEVWRAKKKVASPTRPAPAAPAPHTVKDKALVLAVGQSVAGGRRVRVLPGRDAVAGDTYSLAAATAGSNGLAGVSALVRALKARPELQRLVVDDVTAALKQSPELATLEAARQGP